MQKPIAPDLEAPVIAPDRGLRAFGSRVLRASRSVRYGLGFASLGVFAVILALTAMPLLRILPGTQREIEIRSQRAMHWAVRGYLFVLRVLRVGRFESHGAEKLREPGLLVVANHPSLLDALALISLMPQADCVIKGSHIDHAFLGGAARGAGFIPNWEGASLVDLCAERLMDGRSVIIFPEGTRSPVGELGPFARGAAHIALRSGRDLTPVTIQCLPASLYGRPWWDVPDRMFTLSLRVGDPLLVKDFVDTPKSQSLAARAVTKGLRRHFVSELGIENPSERESI